MHQKFSRYPGVIIAVLYSSGIFLEDVLRIPNILLLGIFSFSILLFFISRKNKLCIYFISLVLLSAGCLKYKIWQTNHIKHDIEPLFPIINATVISRILIPPTSQNPSGTVNVGKLIMVEDTLEINRKFLVDFKNITQIFLPGDELVMENVTIDRFDKRRNPGQFNKRAFLKRKGVFGKIILQAETTIRFTTPHNKNQLKRTLFLIREKIERKIHRALTEESSQFLSAILLGRKAGIDWQTREAFQKSGVAHVLAISGLHVGFIVIVIYIILSFLPISFRAHNLLTIGILFFYMLLSGANPPVVRATIMVGIYLMGKNIERRPDSQNTLCSAVFIILFIQPQQLFWIGFQFSFVAVFSILYFYPRLKPVEEWILQKILPGKKQNWIRKGIISPFLVSLAAQLGTIPLMAYYFHRIPLISLVLNLVVIPLVGLIVPLGFLTIFLSFISFEISFYLGNFLSQIIQILIKIVQYAAELPLAYINISSFEILEFFIYILCLVFIFCWKLDNIKLLRKPALILFVIIMFWVYAPKLHSPQMVMLDVGQGEASIVITPRGKCLLFDAGPLYPDWDCGSRVIFPALQELENVHLDKVIISHPHADHVGGLFSLLDIVKIDSIYIPKLDVPYLWKDKLLNRVIERGLPYRQLEMGDKIEVDTQTRMYILAPFEDFIKPLEQDGSSINNVSLVLLLKMGDSSVLFTGDAELPVETNIIQWGNLLKSDILKVGHHGSATSSSIEFLMRIEPKIGLIPVGQNNKFGHPSIEVLKRLESLNISYYRTDLNGAIWLEYRNSKWQIVDWQ